MALDDEREFMVDIPVESYLNVSGTTLNDPPAGAHKRPVIVSAQKHTTIYNKVKYKIGYHEIYEDFSKNPCRICGAPSNRAIREDTLIIGEQAPPAYLCESCFQLII